MSCWLISHFQETSPHFYRNIARKNQWISLFRPHRYLDWRNWTQNKLELFGTFITGSSNSSFLGFWLGQPYRWWPHGWGDDSAAVGESNCFGILDGLVPTGNGTMSLLHKIKKYKFEPILLSDRWYSISVRYCFQGRCKSNNLHSMDFIAHGWACSCWFPFWVESGSAAQPGW